MENEELDYDFADDSHVSQHEVADEDMDLDNLFNGHDSNRVLDQEDEDYLLDENNVPRGQDGSQASPQLEDAEADVRGPNEELSSSCNEEDQEQQLKEDPSTVAQAKDEDLLASVNNLLDKLKLDGQLPQKPTQRNLLMAYAMKTKAEEILEAIKHAIISNGPNADDTSRGETRTKRADWLSQNCTISRDIVSHVYRAIRAAEGKQAMHEYVVCVFCEAVRCHFSNACPQFSQLALRLNNFASREICLTCARPIEDCLLEPCDPKRSCTRCHHKGHSAFLCNDPKSIAQDSANSERFLAAFDVVGSGEVRVLQGGSRWFDQLLSAKNKKNKKEIFMVSPNATNKKFKQGNSRRPNNRGQGQQGRNNPK